MAMTLEVWLDLGANPKVQLSNRNANARNNKIRWKPRGHDGDLEFKFEDLQELDKSLFPAQTINKKRTRIRCGNRAPSSTKEYEYVIVVSHDGNEYDTTKSGGLPPDDKPVIRNQ